VVDEAAPSVVLSILRGTDPSSAVVVIGADGSGGQLGSPPPVAATAGEPTELGETVDASWLLTAVEVSSSSSSSSLFETSEYRRSSMLFDDDVRSDSVPLLLLFAMSNYRTSKMLNHHPRTAIQPFSNSTTLSTIG